MEKPNSQQHLGRFVLRLALSFNTFLAALLPFLVAACGATATTTGTDDAAMVTPRSLAEQSIDSDEEVAWAARDALRVQGLGGLRALVEFFHAELEELSRYEQGPLSSRLASVREAMDHVSGQRDGHASGLYWHTDLAQAKARARAEEKPILSLRLLGRLDEEMSCANSRLFRLVLYANRRVSAELREHYVLHWSSERPAPRITIDMGDGRTLERTITGNSVHYLLDETGKPIDAWVGLVGPGQFIADLQDGRSRWEACKEHEEDCIRDGHRAAEERLVSTWNDARGELGMPTLDQAALSVLGPQPDLLPRRGAPSALRASRLTMSKLAMERPMLNLLDRPEARPVPLEWVNRLAAQERIDIDNGTLTLLRLKRRSRDAEPLRAYPEPARALIAQDTVLNRTVFRRRIHQLFQEPTGQDWEALNARIYRELLLTPSEDPWLGLEPDGVLDSIEQGGE